MSAWDFFSQDSGEVQEFLNGIYTENEFKILSERGSARTRIYGSDLGDIAQYNVSYSSPFTFLSETERESFLILTCTAGSAQFRRGADLIEFRPGRSGPISASNESRVESGDVLAHISTHISAPAVNSLCAKLLGRPLDGPVLLAHAPFTDEMKLQWDLVVRSLDRLLDTERPSPIATRSLTEYAISLLLEKHPNNYSRFIEHRETLSDRAVRDAQRFILENADRAITVADVAAFVGCSIRALHDGFCEHLGGTPRTYLYFARMVLARKRLTGEGTESSTAEVAQRCGFVDFERFQATYQLRYGESPTETFQRHYRTSRRRVETGSDQFRGSLTPAKIDFLRHQINASLGDRLTVEKLSAMLYMSPQSFAASFKRAFKTTPAQYVLLERLKWARWLLANTDASISAVAAETGFSSQSHLTTALKGRTGDTPHEYRKSAQSSGEARGPALG
jgi:transcriptional regulator GlxA family with amidase domain